MAVTIIPLDEFMGLSADEQVESLKRYKVDYTLKDIRDAWGLKHSAQYYMLLKKLRIYERVVNKSDKYFPPQTTDRLQDAAVPYISHDSPRKEDHFAYQLNTSLPGSELADKLDRIAFFLKGENKKIRVKLLLEAEDAE